MSQIRRSFDGNTNSHKNSLERFLCNGLFFIIIFFLPFSFVVTNQTFTIFVT